MLKKDKIVTGGGGIPKKLCSRMIPLIRPTKKRKMIRRRRRRRGGRWTRKEFFEFGHK
jgi:hypothetical protein